MGQRLVGGRLVTWGRKELWKTGDISHFFYHCWQFHSAEDSVHISRTSLLLKLQRSPSRDCTSLANTVWSDIQVMEDLKSCTFNVIIPSFTKLKTSFQGSMTPVTVPETTLIPLGCIRSHIYQLFLNSSVLSAFLGYSFSGIFCGLGCHHVPLCLKVIIPMSYGQTLLIWHHSCTVS